MNAIKQLCAVVLAIAVTILSGWGEEVGPLEIGLHSNESYTMSNGVLASSAINVGAQGAFYQWDGSTTVSGAVSIAQGYVHREVIGYGSVALNGGTFSASALDINGAYRQGGGTNMVAGDVMLASSSYGFLTISGGTLKDNNVSIGASWVGGYSQSGGVHIIANELSVAGNSGFPQWRGFALSGGQLSVSNIVLTPLAQFSITGGTLHHSGSLSLANANLYVGSGPWQFGTLLLAAGSRDMSTISLSAGSVMLRFANSRDRSWDNMAALVIENWNGLLDGGGAQQIVFGGGGGALTAQQVSQIQFRNPAGASSGTYPARLLDTGEIVPALETLQSHFDGQHPVFSWGKGWTLQTTTNLATPFTDLPGATSPYTNRFPDPQRFFRLRN